MCDCGGNLRRLRKPTTRGDAGLNPGSPPGWAERSRIREKKNPPQDQLAEGRKKLKSDYGLSYSPSGRIQMLRNRIGLPWSCKEIGPREDFTPS